MSKKILIIEDDAALQKALTDTLAERGYEIVSAFDGEDGVAQATREHPDLILLDIILPKKRWRAQKGVQNFLSSPSFYSTANIFLFQADIFYFSYRQCSRSLHNCSPNDFWLSDGDSWQDSLCSGIYSFFNLL